MYTQPCSQSAVAKTGSRSLSPPPGRSFVSSCRCSIFLHRSSNISENTSQHICQEACSLLWIPEKRQIPRRSLKARDGAGAGTFDRYVLYIIYCICMIFTLSHQKYWHGVQLWHLLINRPSIHAFSPIALPSNFFNVFNNLRVSWMKFFFIIGTLWGSHNNL